MNNELLNQGLLIAAIGMGLVFVVIIFLWGLMALLMRLTSGGKKPTAATLPDKGAAPAIAPEVEKIEGQRRAAVAAVAVGLAKASRQKQAFVPPNQEAGGQLSPWQAFHRSRQNTPKSKRG